MNAMSKGSSATSQQSVQSAIKDLTRFIKKLDTVPTEELKASAVTMKAEMVAQAPYKTGRLERSITSRYLKTRVVPDYVQVLRPVLHRVMTTQVFNMRTRTLNILLKVKHSLFEILLLPRQQTLKSA